MFKIDLPGVGFEMAVLGCRSLVLVIIIIIISFAEVLSWIHARLAFAIVRASVLCIRGSRTKWRSLGLEDGAAIDLS